MVRYFPTQILNFTFNDMYQDLFVRNRLSSHRRSHSSQHTKIKSPRYSASELATRKLLAGAAAGATTALLVYPLDLIRTRLTADLGRERQYHGRNNFDDG